MINLLHFLHSPALRVAFILVCVPIPVSLYAASNRGQQFLYYLSDTICGWFERKTPDAPTAKPSSVTTSYIFGQRAVYVGKNYPAKTPDTDSLETPNEQEFSRWLVQLWYGESCSRPPFGWFCTRGKGHTGSCPARPVPARQIPDPTTETAPAKRCHWCLDGYPRCWVNGEAFHDSLGFSWRCDETRKASMPAVLGAPYDFSSDPATGFYDGFKYSLGAPPSVNDTVAAQAEPLYRTFVLNRDAFVDPKTCGCTACRDFRNRVFKTDPGALGAPHDEFAVRAWQALSKLEQDEEQALDAFRARHQNQKLCKHPKGFVLGRCPVCFMAGDDLR